VEAAERPESARRCSISRFRQEMVYDGTPRERISTRYKMIRQAIAVAESSETAGRTADWKNARDHKDLKTQRITKKKAFAKTVILACALRALCLRGPVPDTMPPHICGYVDNKPGVLNRVSSLFRAGLQHRVADYPSAYRDAGVSRMTRRVTPTVRRAPAGGAPLQAGGRARRVTTSPRRRRFLARTWR